VKLTSQDFKRRALLGHVVVPVIVPGLNAAQSVRLQMPSDFAAHSGRGQQRLDTRANALQLKAIDRVADHVVCPARQRPHTDGLLPSRRRDGELTFALQEG
jgi:hypothetical protein